MKVEQIQRSDVWNYLQNGTIVWIAIFNHIGENSLYILNDQSVRYVRGLVSYESDNEMFFRMVEE